MNRKSLWIMIAVLAVILAAGILFAAHLSLSQKPENPVTEMTDGVTIDDPAEQPQPEATQSTPTETQLPTAEHATAPTAPTGGTIPTDPPMITTQPTTGEDVPQPTVSENTPQPTEDTEEVTQSTEETHEPIIPTYDPGTGGLPVMPLG